MPFETAGGSALVGTDHETVGGGCQCGAVRYAVRLPIRESSLCHCRMCQKASGGPFMVFFAVPTDTVTWTRGAPTLFASSSLAVRGFCRDCGTPLSYQYKQERLSLTHGSLDDPSVIGPTAQLASAAALPWSTHVGDLPTEHLDGWLAREAPAGIVNYQQPDRD